jgi:hypothetical protein
MANLLNGFLDNLLTATLNPKGDMGDFRHASYLFSNNTMALAPKHKHLYHVVFELSAEALQLLPILNNKYKEEINMLVKSADLPQMTAAVETRNQYNRKKNFQTNISYSPVTITMHDDNLGATTLLLEAYYRYYYKDGSHFTNPGPFDARATYKGGAAHEYRYGLDNDSQTPFFKQITIYHLARQEYTGYTLVNPLITSWGHDRLADDDGQTASNTMQVMYESVAYSRGKVVAGPDGSPRGFGNRYYDQTPSPLSIAGGGTETLLGPGGIADGIGDILSQPFGLSTILNGANLIKNAKNLTKEGLRSEGFAVAGMIGNVILPSGSGIGNIAFPKNSGRGGSLSDIATRGGGAAKGTAAFAGKLAQAQQNNSTNN